jgi:hypothetical protein
VQSLSLGKNQRQKRQGMSNTFGVIDAKRRPPMKKAIGISRFVIDSFRQGVQMDLIFLPVV